MPHRTSIEPFPSITKVKVKPSAIVKSHVTALPPVDQYMARLNLPHLLFFRLHQQANPRKIFWDLRCGLSDALVEFPFFAGQLVLCDSVRNRLEIRVSSDDGVTFIYNDLTSPDIQPPFPSFDMLEREHFPLERLDSSLACHDQILTSNDVANPCLSAKASFIDGGLILGICIHHTATDNAGNSALLKSWAKHTRAASQGTRIPPEPSDASLDRSPLFATTHEMTLDDCPMLSKSDQVPINSVAPLDSVVMTYWYFSASAMRSLKIACSPPKAATDPWISSNDALATLIWRHVSLARQLPAANNAMSTFLMPCDVRAKLEPPLPKEYAGNCVHHVHFAYPLSELYSTAPDSLYRTAATIRANINGIDDHAIRGVFGVIDRLPTVGENSYIVNFWPGPDFFLTSCAAHEWYDFDWGCQMGKMARKRFPRFMFQPSGWVVNEKNLEGGVEVCAVMEQGVFERLKADETFMRYAELRCS